MRFKIAKIRKILIKIRIHKALSNNSSRIISNLLTSHRLTFICIAKCRNSKIWLQSLRNIYNSRRWTAVKECIWTVKIKMSINTSKIKTIAHQMASTVLIPMIILLLLIMGNSNPSRKIWLIKWAPYSKCLPSISTADSSSSRSSSITSTRLSSHQIKTSLWLPRVCKLSRMRVY
jgi:hypothetical protein